jgi:hypothetical protein
MPWCEVSVMDQRREFVRLERTGESFAGGSVSIRRRAINGLADGRPIKD